jgi:uncharacterized membrane protein (DUF4010 family)
MVTAVASELEAAARLSLAGLIGFGVGLEREWSGHTAGPDARFAGLRTFLMLGLVGGGCGILAAMGYATLASALGLGGGALAVTAYYVAASRPGAGVDGTTEAAALAVLMLAALAGVGWLTLAAGAGSVVVLALSEKNRLHGLVSHLGDRELHAALQFTVLAVVVLPLLPTGPLFGPLALRPRALWIVVLLYSGLNFAGYIARRVFGVRRGYGITGALGGLVSSTAVTLNFSRQSIVDRELGVPLARGVVAACTVLVPRVLAISSVLNPDVMVALLPALLPPFVVGLSVVAFAWKHDTSATSADDDTKSPLRFASALQMAIAFQIAITAISFARTLFGSAGLFGAAALLGLTDVDALTVSMSSPASQLTATVAARALAVGVISNTLLKLLIVVVVGRGTYRRAAAAGMLGLAVAAAVGLFLIR